jgi:hypothetical protein
MKKPLVGIAGIIVAAIVIATLGAGLARYRSPDQMARRAIERVASETMQASVRVDSVQISPADGTGFITGLTVGNPAGFSTATALKAASIGITLEMASLDKEATVIRTLSVATPHFTYEWSRSGSNFARLLENTRLDKGREPGRKLIIERLVLHEAHVSYASPANAGQMITVDLPNDIRISNVGRQAGGVTSREFATTIVEALIYHINRKIPASALQGGSIAPAAPGVAAGK